MESYSLLPFAVGFLLSVVPWRFMENNWYCGIYQWFMPLIADVMEVLESF